jgi:SAM-dependent methyltransferase
MEAGDVANPFDDAAVASRYEGWYVGRGRRADGLEKELLEKLLGRFPAAASILEVGCGTGHFTRWFAQKGFDVVGLDVSEAMLREARRLGGPTNYLRADALSLPFADRSYDLTTMITTLEFLADPVRALAEAARVARQGLLLGVLNRWSVLALRYRLSRNPEVVGIRRGGSGGCHGGGHAGRRRQPVAADLVGVEPIESRDRCQAHGSNQATRALVARRSR